MSKAFNLGFMVPEGRRVHDHHDGKHGIREASMAVVEREGEREERKEGEKDGIGIAQASKIQSSELTFNNTPPPK